VQLAAAVAELTSGSGGVLDRLRGAIGVDVLRVQGSGDEDSEAAGPTVQAGKYVSDNVFVGVEQGLSSQSSGVVVEVEVFNNVKVKSGVGQSGSTNLGVVAEWDY
jgi:translocation and assembly module TamB